MRLRAKPVVNLNRGRKARMIEAFVAEALGREPRDLRVLDLGCGNGDICAQFARSNQAVGIDVADQCRVEYMDLSRCVGVSESLPFRDGVFHVVISHHVIEHVQDHDLHMSEINRVLAPGGLCYLGTPNLSSPFMRGHVGNSMVLRYQQMRPLFERHGFEVEEYYARWLHQPDRDHCETRLFRFMPMPMLLSLRRWFPSQCFLLRPRVAVNDL